MGFQTEPLEDKIEELENKLKIAVKVLEMVEDHRKMPHYHKEPRDRLYCLTERASEALEKIGKK